MYGRTALHHSVRPRRWSPIVAALVVGLLLGYLARFATSPSSQHGPPPPAASTTARGTAATHDRERADGVLVLYSFFVGDEMSWGNLEYFAKHGVVPGDGAQYVIILNGLDAAHTPPLPDLPRNARYVHHTNECYDWGTYAWALDNVGDISVYKYFIFINGSVRGPILPWYALDQHWTRLFTAKITDTVKLVGPAISCEHFCLTTTQADGHSVRNCRQNAHVQSVALATDTVGLATLRAAGYVLRCHANRAEAVYYGEIGASLAILEAGYSIDSFLARYQGVNWRDRNNWQCNGNITPIGKRTFDGVTLTSLELVFPKLKGSLLESGLPSHFEALQMSTWIATPAAERGVTKNWFKGEGRQVHAEDVVIAEAKGQACFDWMYYRSKNPDVAHLPQDAMWKHFLSRGAFEFREHRWLCGLNADAIIPTL